MFSLVEAYRRSFQGYARNRGMHPAELVGTLYIKQLIKGSHDMNELIGSIERGTNIRVLCGVEVCDLVDLLRYVGGGLKTIPHDFELTMEEMKNHPSYKRVLELGRKIVEKELGV